MADLDKLFDSLPSSESSDADAAFDAIPSPSTKEAAPEISTGEAAARSLLSGATLGLSPRILAGLETVPGYAMQKAKAAMAGTPLSSTDSISDVYGKALANEQANQAAVEKQHPYISAAGNIGGSLALPLGELKILSRLGILSPALEQGGNLARLGGVLESGATGAAIGGVSGAANAKPGNVAQGAEQGALGGAALGTGLGAAGAGIGAGIESLAEGSSPLAPIAQKFVMGNKEGVNLLFPGKILDKFKNSAATFAEEHLAGTAEDLQNQVASVLQKARQDGTPVPEEALSGIRDAIGSLKDKLKDTKNEQFVSEGNNLLDQALDRLEGLKQKVNVPTVEATSSTIPEVKGSQAELQEEAEKRASQARVNGENKTYNIVHDTQGGFDHLMETTPTPEGGFTTKSVKQLPFEAPEGEVPFTAIKPGNISMEARPGTPATAGDVYDLERNLGQQRYDKVFKTPEGADAAKQLDNAVTDAVNNIIPEYGTAPEGQLSLRQKYSVMKDAFKRLGFDPTKVFVTDPTTGIEKVDPNAVKAIANIMKKSVTNDAAASAGFDSFEHAIDGLEQISGKDMSPAVSDLQRQAQHLKAAQQVSQGTYLPGFGPIGRVANLGALANIAGNVNRVAAPVVQGAINRVGMTPAAGALGQALAPTPPPQIPNPITPSMPPQGMPASPQGAGMTPPVPPVPPRMGPSGTVVSPTPIGGQPAAPAVMPPKPKGAPVPPPVAQLPQVQQAAGKNAFPGQNKSSDTGTQDNLYASSPMALHGVAAKLQGNTGLKFLGNHLEQALQDNNDQMKNAALFAIAQNPEARKFLGQK